MKPITGIYFTTAISLICRPANIFYFENWLTNKEHGDINKKLKFGEKN